MIYLIVFLLLLILTLKYEFRSIPKFSNEWYNFVLIIFILVAGLRYKVGGDTLSYFDYYEGVKNWSNTDFSELMTGRYSFLWNVLATTCKTISNDFVVLQIVQAGFVNITIFWFIKKYSKFRFTSLILYFIFSYLYFNTEIMRESIAICFFLLAYPYFERKSWLKYYLIVTLAFLFHSSAVILFLFPILSIIKFNLKSLALTIVLLVFFIFILSKNPTLMDLLLFTDTISEKFNAYSEYALNINGKIVVFLSFIAFPYALFRINSKIKKEDGKLFENLYMVYFVIAMSYVAFSGFSRFVNYLTPFMIVYFAYTLNNIYISQKYKNVKRPFILVIFILAFIPKYLYYTADMSRFYPDTRKYNLYHPYSSIISPEEYDFRRIIFSESMRESANKE